MQKIFMSVLLGGALIGCGGGGKKASTVEKPVVAAEGGAEGAEGGATEGGATEGGATEGGEGGEGGEVHGHGHGEGGEGGEGEHAEWPNEEMKAFHDALHPVWHEQLPKKDWAGICAAAPKLAEASGAMKIARVNRDMQKAYTDKAMKVADSSEDLVAECDPAKPEKGEKHLTKLHNHFHDLVALFR